MSCPAHALAVSRRFLEWEDVDLIRSLVASLPTDRPVRIADLGAGSGTTAGSVYAERSDAEVWTIDHSAENIMWAGKFLEGIGVGKQWHHLLGDTAERAKDFAEPIDMLMIDSSHEYDHTVRELTAWLPKLRDPALVWCHDYRGYPGVEQAVNEFVAAGKLEQIDVRGLGWAGKRL